MANYDYTLGTAGSGLYKTVEKNSHFARKHVISFADVLATKGSALATNDTVDILTLNPGERVVNVTARVITAGTASSTVTVGDQSDADGYIASVACDGTAGTVSGANGAYLFTQYGTTPFAVTWVGGKSYSATNTLRMTLGATAPQAGVVEFTAFIEQVGTDSAI